MYQRPAIGICPAQVRYFHGPALAASGGELLMAWKGSGNDDRLWRTENNFHTEHPVREGCTTSDTPALVGIDFGEL